VRVLCCQQQQTQQGGPEQSGMETEGFYQ
jgi:hypothetical protein